MSSLIRCIFKFQTFLWLALLSTVQVAAADESHYVLTQRSLKLGDQYTYLTPNAVRLTNPKSGASIICKAPEWNVDLFNDKTHLWGSIKNTAFKHLLAADGTSEFLSGRWERQKNSVNVCGLKCTEYKIHGERITYMANGVTDRKTGVTGGVYVVYDGIQLDSRLAELMRNAFNIPLRTSVPISMHWNLTDGTIANRLQTYRVDRTTLPAAFFDIPAGYKQATNPELVFLSPDQLEMMQMMAEGGDAKVVEAQKALNRNNSPRSAAEPVGINYDEREVKGLLERMRQPAKK